LVPRAVEGRLFFSGEGELGLEVERFAVTVTAAEGLDDGARRRRVSRDRD
jgi:hypothetical protein